MYFGTDEEAVRNANMRSAEYKDTKDLGSENYEPGKLDWNTTYYWRVDEYNTDETISEGRVWSFTTYAAIEKVENFETGDFSRLLWEHSGDENWVVTSRQKHSGAYSAKAGGIEDDGNTTLQVTLDLWRNWDEPSVARSERSKAMYKCNRHWQWTLNRGQILTFS